MPSSVARLTGRQTCVVHGNPNNPGNVRMTANRVALIDWDEARVDVPDLDLVLPHNAAGLDDGARHRRASVGRMGSRRLPGRRARGQAARRSSSGLSSGSETDRGWDAQLADWRRVGKALAVTYGGAGSLGLAPNQARLPAAWLGLTLAVVGFAESHAPWSSVFVGAWQVKPMGVSQRDD